MHSVSDKDESFLHYRSVPRVWVKDVCSTQLHQTRKATDQRSMSVVEFVLNFEFYFKLKHDQDSHRVPRKAGILVEQLRLEAEDFCFLITTGLLFGNCQRAAKLVRTLETGRLLDLRPGT